MTPEIRTVPAFHVVAIKVVGRHSELSHRVPVAWLDLTKRLDQIPHKVDPTLFYGLFPESDQLIDGENGVLTYWVGTAVSEVGALPEGMVALSLPEQRYVVATAKGPKEAISQSYMTLFGWLKETGHRTDGERLGFELYDANRMAVTPPYDQFDYDIYKPLA